MFTYNRGVVVSTKVNFTMVHRLLHSSVTSFWDRIPIGRVLNRFSQDQRKVDNQMPGLIDDLLGVTFALLLDFALSSGTSSLWL